MWKSYVLLSAFAFANDGHIYMFKTWNFPNKGYYCPDDELSSLEIPLHHCILHCLQMKDCTALNYNNYVGLCVLLPAPCTLAYQRKGMEYAVFTGRKHSQCLKWVPVRRSDDRVVKSHDGYLSCRLKVHNGTFLGHYSEPIRRCWATDGEVEYDSRSNPSEILTVSPECTVGWVNYTAGTPLPPSAVMAGQSYAGENLYVVMHMLPIHDGHFITGYYNVGLGMGYVVAFRTPRPTMVMDLLILLWMVCRGTWMYDLWVLFKRGPVIYESCDVFCTHKLRAPTPDTRVNIPSSLHIFHFCIILVMFFCGRVCFNFCLYGW